MNKLVDKDRLDKAAKALNKIIKDSTNTERERAIAAEELLETAIENTTQMFGGKSIKYVTQEQFNAMTEEEQNNPIITYFIIDAEDLSHTHNNKDLLDNFGARTLTVGNSGKTFDGSENLFWTLNEIGAAPVDHNHDDKYYTEAEVDEKLETVNAITLNGYSLWVGTTEELEAIAEKDPNTLYFEIDNGTDEEVIQVDVVNGVLQLTDDKYQKTNMVDGAEIVFPTVNKFTEIHLYFSTESNMNLNFPDNCRWRVEPNIEEGKSYEIIATYNTIEWLVNVIVYS